MSLFNTSILRFRKAGEFKISVEAEAGASVSSDAVSVSFSSSARRHVEVDLLSKDREDTSECGLLIENEFVGSAPRSRTPKMQIT